MLRFDVYRNVMYMMHHREMEDADELIEEIEKESPSTFLNNPRFHNMGIDFKSGITSDLKEIEERVMMSFCLTDERRKHKQIVFFGNNSKSFLQYMTMVMLKNDFPDYTCYYVIVTAKEFTSKLSEKVTELSQKFNVTRFYDDNLIKPPFHSYGAKYELMTESELNLLMSELHITKKEMKKISKEDPLVKYYGWTTGKGVRLHQTPMIAGSLVKNMIDYRIIV